MSDTNARSCAASAGASPWILRWLERLPRGATVLDFAAGSGRHARAAIERGMHVVAIDRDEQALARLRDAMRAPTTEADRVDIAHGGTLALRVADLEAGPWPFAVHERFDAVVVANYLFRPRFALLAALVAPGGLLVYETFAQGNERYGRPSNPAFLLAPGELLVRARRAGLTVIGYEAGIVQRPAPAAIQRVCAVRAPVAEAVATLG
ncbi:MAG: class I SAM-dependent methyltransferase [Burkholderiaceae bacterium]|nr:class I SAM-dependent methyltransferase [Burkholderiaceae bacterium]